MSAAGTPSASDVEPLVTLDARSWAQLLRALRRLDTVPEGVASLLDRPTSELSGALRRELCEAFAADVGLVGLLVADRALPATVLAALGDLQGSAGGRDAAASEPDEQGAGEHGADEQGAGEPADERAQRRAEERARELRRTLDEERRRREGAEARAATATAASEAVAVERDRLVSRVEDLERELADVRGTVEQAAARAERRSASRIGALERDLSDVRRTLEQLRQDHDRTLGELAAAREELASVRAAGQAVPTSPGGGPSGPARVPTLPDTIVEGTTEAARWLADRVGLIVVDGYNVTLLLRPGRPLEEQRRWLVERMRPLAARRADRPVVVFDGAGTSGSMRGTGGVEVRFTPEGVTADDEIVFIVAATDAPVLVVTDDVELAARVRAEGGTTVGSVHLAGIVDG